MPEPGVDPGSPPYVVPGVQTIWSNVGARPRYKLGHKRVRPPRGTKERKIALPAAAAAFKGVFNFVTEGSDFIGAFFDAIHWTAKQEAGALGFMNPADKASFVYANFHLINWREAMKNLMKNAGEDFVYGFAGKGVTNFNRMTGNTGFKDAALQHGSSAGTSKAQQRDGDPVKAGLDEFGELIDATFGTDVEWTMAQATAATGRRTRGLPQQDRIYRWGSRHYEAPKVKRWEAHSQSARRRLAKRGQEQRK